MKKVELNIIKAIQTETNFKYYAKLMAGFNYLTGLDRKYGVHNEVLQNPPIDEIKTIITLVGNPIAMQWNDGRWAISIANWPSRLTYSRLGAILTQISKDAYVTKEEYPIVLHRAGMPPVEMHNDNWYLIW